MKSWSDTLVLPRPLRDARLSSLPLTEGPEPCGADRERESFERGRREGERALGEQLLRQRTELLDLQNGVFAALRQSLPQVARECEATLVELALEVAQKLVAGLPISVEMVEAAVHEGIARLADTGVITVHLHPEDHALLQQVNSPLLLEEAGGERMRFNGSPEISRGGCLVETGFGSVDTRRETKLGLLRGSLLN